MRHAIRKRALTLALVAAAVAAPPVAAQRAPDAEERAFLEMLQRTDPSGYARFTELRDERDRRQAEVERLRQQMSEAGELRAIVLPQLRTARRRWAESSIALIDFLDERDRKQLAAYQSAIGRITEILDQRRQARDELEKTLRSE
jgi:hypothetical protein